MREKRKKTSNFKKKQAYARYERFLLLGKRVALGVFIVSFVWISVDGYHRLVSRQIVEESSHLIKPLSPQIKVEVLDKIRAKEYFVIEEVDSYFKESSPSGESEKTETTSEE
ncbi:hypothetical protein ISS42_02230 [Candidatus Shapirobacteria bacterium]|nr:hypothetical protein [Candidatus Shapirobacteria bacterium]